jgi:hypothetical protein
VNVPDIWRTNVELTLERFDEVGSIDPLFSWSRFVVASDDERWANIEQEGVGVPYLVREWFRLVPESFSMGSGLCGFRPVSLDFAMDWRNGRRQPSPVLDYTSRILVPVLSSDVGDVIAAVLTSDGEEAVSTLLVYVHELNSGFVVLDDIVTAMSRLLLCAAELRRGENLPPGLLPPEMFR